MRIILIILLFFFIPFAWAETVSTNLIAKEIVTNYPITLQSDKAICRVVTYKDESNVTPLKEFKLIFNDEIIFQKQIKYIEEKGNYIPVTDIGINFYFFKMFKGNNADYLIYVTDTLPGMSPLEFYTCRIVKIYKDNDKYISQEFDGYLAKIGYDFNNPKIDENTYELLDNKYIITNVDDSYFHITMYYEIKENSFNPANMEFKILPRQFQNWNELSGTVVLYMQPDKSSAQKNIILKPTSKIKFIGMRYLDTTIKNKYDYNYLSDSKNHMVHVMIDEQEGWVIEDQCSLLGLWPTVIGVW